MVKSFLNLIVFFNKKIKIIQKPTIIVQRNQPNKIHNCDNEIVDIDDIYQTLNQFADFENDMQIDDSKSETTTILDFNLEDDSILDEHQH
jgi:hypothetical protein